MIDEWRSTLVPINKNYGFIKNCSSYKGIKTYESYMGKSDCVYIKRRLGLQKINFDTCQEGLQSMLFIFHRSWWKGSNDIVLIEKQGKGLTPNLSFGDRHWNQTVFTWIGVRWSICIASLSRKKQEENDLELEVKIRGYVTPHTIGFYV